MSETRSDHDHRLTFMQRVALRRLRKAAGKSGGEPLSEEDWGHYWHLMDRGGGALWHRILTALPSSPRCRVCGSPFGGAGGRMVARLGYTPSRKNPSICATCVELAPPGGLTMDAGILFIDIRGFTSRSEGAAPAEAVQLLRRFYSCAEDVLFPEALIDKLIGDEVMALYLPPITDRDDIGALMLDHAEALLRKIGYGTEQGPFVEAGIGLDFGQAFVGNIGDRAVFDFTAVGDVVNTASRLQGQAGGGEIVLSDRVAAGLDQPPGERVALELKGKSVPAAAYRVRVG